MSVEGNGGDFASFSVGYRKPHGWVLSLLPQGGFSSVLLAVGDLCSALRKTLPVWEDITAPCGSC